MKDQKIQIGRRFIGKGHPCFIIAEAGSNHNGSLEQAKQLIAVAADAKADAVKFQVFRAKKMYPKDAGECDYLKISKPIFEIISDMEMPFEWLDELKVEADRLGIEFMASVFDTESLEYLEPLVGIHKVASYELTHHPLLEAIAKSKKPVILSTGTAEMDEIEDAIAILRENQSGPVVLMQCTAAYPAPLETLNIRAMSTMEETFHVPVGLSDHSQDPIVGPVCALAKGATVIEKHFTLSKELPGPDHRFALEPDELFQMVQKIREAEKAMGSSKKQVGYVEQELRVFARRSLFAVCDIQLGELFTQENVDVLRNGKSDPGLEPSAYKEVIGSQAASFIEAEKSDPKTPSGLTAENPSLFRKDYAGNRHRRHRIGRGLSVILWEH